MSFAVLWERWDKDDAFDSFTIITTVPSPDLTDIHCRQPAIIDPDQFDNWLDPSSPVPHLLDLVHQSYDGITSDVLSPLG